MSEMRSEPQPASPGDKRMAGDRRENAERRRMMTAWPDADRRQQDRRSWVGRRQAAAWRLLEISAFFPNPA